MFESSIRFENVGDLTCLFDQADRKRYERMEQERIVMAANKKPVTKNRKRNTIVVADHSFFFFV